MSETQKSVLLGTLLGDGALKKRGNFHRLHIKHSSNQIVLAQYKRDVFSNITSMKVRSFTQEVKGKNYGFCEFVTLTHQSFSDMYSYTYPEGKKLVTKKWLANITHPLSLAVWFMDDGSADFAGLAFNTQSFSLKEIELLRRMLKRTFNLETLFRKNKRGWIIYVPKHQVEKFSSLVKPYMLSEFYYKLTPYSFRT